MPKGSPRPKSTETRLKLSDSVKKAHQKGLFASSGHACQDCEGFFPEGTPKYRLRCEPCKKKLAVQRVAAWRERNPEKLLVQREKDLPRARRQAKAYQLEHRNDPVFREKCRKRVKQWWADHYTEWYKKNNIKLRSKSRLRYAQYIEANFTQEEWESLLDAYDHCCAYCGTSVKKLTMDHIVPISKGGPHIAANIAPACQSCNSSKKDRPLNEWLNDRGVKVG